MAPSNESYVESLPDRVIEYNEVSLVNGLWKFCYERVPQHLLVEFAMCNTAEELLMPGGTREEAILVNIAQKFSNPLDIYDSNGKDLPVEKVYFEIDPMSGDFNQLFKLSPEQMSTLIAGLDIKKLTENYPDQINIIEAFTTVENIIELLKQDDPIPKLNFLVKNIQNPEYYFLSTLPLGFIKKNPSVKKVYGVLISQEGSGLTHEQLSHLKGLLKE